MSKKCSVMRPIAASALLLCSTAVWAGAPATVSVDYAPLPNAAAVPTLGEWTLILMALLMAVIAYRALRGRVNGRLLSNAVLAGGAVAATVAGNGLIREVEAAITYVDYEMSIPTGGTVNGQGWMKLINTSGVPLRITAIRLGNPEVAELVPPTEESPECKVGLLVSPTANCYMKVELVDSIEEPLE